jgi:Flp pilus assembly protein TadG
VEGAKRCSIAYIPVRVAPTRVAVMETALIRILLLVVLFILRTGDYTELFNQILQLGTTTSETPRGASRTASKSYNDDDTDVTHIDDSLDIYCESLQTIHYMDISIFYIFKTLKT